MDLLRDHANGLESQLNLQIQIVDKGLALAAVTPNGWPVLGRVGSQFGNRLDPFENGSEMHLGLDIVAPVGSTVRAPAAGIVEIAQRESTTAI
jgi:murein DD-endopeptidase MepM/ murein hydrolase activator NlpD